MTKIQMRTVQGTFRLAWLSGLRLRIRALTFLELVFAIGVLFFAAGGVMSIIVAGAGMPVKVQNCTTRDLLAKQQLDIAMAADPPAATGGFMPVPGAPDYSYQVTLTSASFDTSTNVVTVAVQGPSPQATTTMLRGMCTPVTPAQGANLFNGDPYYCSSCHSGGAGPALTAASLQAGLADRNSQISPPITLDQYIEESIRVPAIYVVPGYTPLMAGYPTVTDMPPSDLKAIRAYLKTL